ncbi:MAG: peptidoglycan DD-metalloendopeptidase family protein [Propionibacteriaceae bacterium]|jgi:murein DD-endopeptidase MepM/ murein hydrolase activator NlpD|nr:peptidoglycan DD-metalloendopeptidase family protein [Propionibacteriaceae bacterium]
MMSHTAWTPRLAAIGCAVAIALGGLLVAAQAEDLDTEKSKADSAVASAQEVVSQSEAALNLAKQRVADAQSRVAEAQTAFEAAQAVADSARQLAALRSAELAAAQQALASAKVVEAEGQEKVDVQRDAVGAYARSIVQDSYPLVSFAALFDTKSTASLSDRLQWNETVLAANQYDLNNLRKLQVALVAARLESERLEKAAAEAKLIADEQLAVAEAAETAAEAARNSLQIALDEQRAAQAAAAQALADDQQALAEAKAEQTAVNDRIAEAARAAERKRQEEAAAAAAAGQAPAPQTSSTGLIWPHGGWITSPYGYRVHPIWGTWRWHDGVDIGIGCGTPIKAMASGVVTDAYYHFSYGNRIFVDHGWVNGRYLVSSYNHMSGFAAGAGQWVSQGQTIGYIGSTGDSTGCHDHLMLWVNGSTVNPLDYLP